MQEASRVQEPIKDPGASHPIPSTWRPALREIVKAFARGDHALAGGIPSVAPVPSAKADQIGKYVRNYGETLAELPDEAWETSVSQWMGTHWEVLIDLWTVESGQSDMVLSARVFEEEEGFRFEIESVHVP
jgi:hypothetical protein